MSNMSYCRFENTRDDLADCLNAVEEQLPTSTSEIQSAKSMFINILHFFWENDIIESYNQDALFEMLDAMKDARS